MNLEDNNPMSGMEQFMQLFADAERFYMQGEATPLEACPPLNKVADVAVPKGYFATRVAEIHRETGYCTLCLVREGPLPVGKSGQYTSLKVVRTVDGIAYPGTYAAYLMSAGEALWVVYLPDTPVLHDYLAGLTVGATVEVSRPLGDFGYNPLRDSREVVALCAEDSVAPILSVAIAVALGKYPCRLTVHCYGPFGQYMRDLLDNAADTGTGVGVVYHDDSAAPAYTRGNTVMVAVGKGSAYLYDLAVSMTDDPKYLRVVRCAEDEPRPYGAPCVVRVHCFDGDHVLDARVGECLVDVLECSRVAVETRCRNGECGWCRVRVVQGDYDSLPHAKPRQADVMYGYVHACRVILKGDMEIAIEY